MSRDSEPEAGSPQAKLLHRLVAGWRAHSSEIWKLTKTVGVGVGIVGTGLGIFVDVQETSQILDAPSQVAAVASVSQVLDREPTPSAGPVCGDGEIQPEEECDDGGAFGGALCSSECTSNLARIDGGSLLVGYREAELDAGMHLLMPSRRPPEMLREVAEWATPATPVQFGKFWIMRNEVSWKALIAFLDHKGSTAKDVVIEDGMERVKGFPSVRSPASIAWHLQAMADTRAKYAAGMNNRGRPDEPARTDLKTAIAYCAWLGGIVPTESQWEAAARGPGGKRTFPWGERVPKASPEDCELLTGFFHISVDPPEDFNCGGRNPTTPGARAAGCTPDGVCDLAGNVDEYVTPGATIWKEVDGRTAEEGKRYMAVHPGPQRDAQGAVKFLRVCADLAREDPYGLVSGTLSDCVVGDGFAPEQPWTATSYPADRGLAIVKGGNFDDSLPVLYQNRARYPYGASRHAKGFRCVVQ